ncbi:hypothetical protein [Deinococcus irradiatisoli]|uniref:hypothetical protein n=1 Tax=Deinococcus irradiatisoli TaxID=2202254 RepID=UPI0011B25CEF|nr:hypothetical protein [Deinococcus irradiatisoli]
MKEGQENWVDSYTTQAYLSMVTFQHDYDHRITPIANSICGCMETSTKELLGVADIRNNLGLGRDLTTALVRLLPHITLGRSGRGDRRLVRRADLDLLLRRATEEQRDLWELSRDFTPDTLRAWLGNESQGAN